MMLPPISETTVLCVEDEPLVAAEVVLVLREMGFGAVLAAHNLQSARAAAENVKIDIALLDVNLGGGTCSTAFGASLAQGGAHVVFASGYAKAELGAVVQEFDFLEKPIGRDDIERYFRELFDQRPIAAV